MNAASAVPAPYWFRHDPRFCRTGDTFAQPLQAGMLQPEFWPSECGSLDAPQYLPVGGIAVHVSRHDDGRVFLSEQADIDRERAAELAEPRRHYEDDFEFWAPDEERYAA